MKDAKQLLGEIWDEVQVLYDDAEEVNDLTDFEIDLYWKLEAYYKGH